MPFLVGAGLIIGVMVALVAFFVLCDLIAHSPVALIWLSVVWGLLLSGALGYLVMNDDPPAWLMVATGAETILLIFATAIADA